MDKKDKQNKLIKELGTAIKRRRKALRMSQEDLALLSDTSINFVCQLERGKNTVRLDKLLDVMQSIGLEFNIINGSSQISFKEDVEH